MKNLLYFSVVALFLTAASTNAQFKLKLGPNVGMNYNITTGSDVDETFTGFGFLIGAQVDMSFTPVVGLVTNLQFYDSRSSSSEVEGTTQGVSYTVDDDLSIAYFLVEPLFKLTIPNSGFFFLVGPEFGFSVQSSRTMRVSSENDQVKFQDGSTKNKASLKDMNARFAMKFGSGYDIPVSRMMYITPQINFGYGLTNVRENVEARILTIQTLVTVKFRLL